MVTINNILADLRYGTKVWHWWIAANKHFGGQDIGGLAVLHTKVVRIKVFGRLVTNRQIGSSFLPPCYVVFIHQTFAKHYRQQIFLLYCTFWRAVFSLSKSVLVDYQHMALSMVMCTRNTLTLSVSTSCD